MGLGNIQLGTAAWGFRETPLERQLEITRGLGLCVLELGIAGHENDRLQVGATNEAIAEVKALFAHYGVQSICASTGNDFTQADEAACFADLEKIKRVSEIAAKLGVSYLRIFAGFSPAEEVTGARWERMVRCLNEAAGHATPLGIKLTVETHGGVATRQGGVVHFHSVTTRPEMLARLQDEVDQRIGLLFDPANLGAVGMSETRIATLYRALRPRICTLHLKDFKTAGAGALQPCACGEGKLNWGILMAVFRDFDGIGMMEYEIPGDIESGLCRTLSAINSCL